MTIGPIRTIPTRASPRWMGEPIWRTRAEHAVDGGMDTGAIVASRCMGPTGRHKTIQETVAEQADRITSTNGRHRQRQGGHAG